jgi:hypothetical protein
MNYSNDILGYFVIGLVLIACIYIYVDGTESFQLKCIVSTVDGNKYCVREREKIQQAADLLAKITEKCKQLVKYVGEKHSDNEDVKRLVAGFAISCKMADQRNHKSVVFLDRLSNTSSVW